MSALAPMIGLLVAAAITPGPNNVIAMEAGARGRSAAALWAAAGAAASRLLDRPHVRQVFNLAMGGVLALSAAGMVAHALLE